jgi:hypothetical protein
VSTDRPRWGVRVRVHDVQSTHGRRRPARAQRSCTPEQQPVAYKAFNMERRGDKELWMCKLQGALDACRNTHCRSLRSVDGASGPAILSWGCSAVRGAVAHADSAPLGGKARPVSKGCRASPMASTSCRAPRRPQDQEALPEHYVKSGTSREALVCACTCVQRVHWPQRGRQSKQEVFEVCKGPQIDVLHCW